MRFSCQVITLATLVLAACGRGGAPNVYPDAARGPAVCVPLAQDFERIFNPSRGRAWFWYVNDHSIVRGPDGRWHLFGITHREPLRPHHERQFVHASSATLTAPDWTRHEPALEADQPGGETLLWAPHVFEHEGLFYMLYCAGGEDPAAFQMKLATSSNLTTWKRHPTVLFSDGYEARDPFVMRVGGRWVLYYTATSEPDEGHHVVAYRTSEDLLTWSARKIAYRDPEVGKGAGGTESPFVVARDEGYYLFIGPRNGYVSTEVFFSHDPLHFEGPPLVELGAHAAEVVRDLDGAEYLSHAGWFQRGVYLAPLRWSCGG